MSTLPNPSATDLLWKQYELHVKLYQHYLELVLKFNVFYYAVTGAILSFYFANRVDFGLPRSTLLLFPIAMSVAFGGMFVYASLLVKFSRAGIADIAKALGLQVFPEITVLTVLLRISAGLFFFIAGAIAVIVCHATRTG